MTDADAPDDRLTRRALRRAERRARRTVEPAIERLSAAQDAAVAWVDRRDRKRDRRERLRRTRLVGLPRPWKHYLRRARGAYRHLIQTVEQVPDGPLRVQLTQVEDQMAAGLDAVLDAARGGASLAARHQDLARLLPPRPLFASREADAVKASREVVDKLAEQVRDARARLSTQTLAMVEVATHALDLVVAGDLGERVDDLVEDLLALQASLSRVPGP